MVVGLVLEVYQPLLGHAVNLNRNYNTAGIDLVRHLQILKLALCTQLLHGKQCQIHQADKFVITALVEHLAVSQVIFIGSLDRSLVISVGDGHVL